MRIGIIGLLHESNTFIHDSTGLEDFRGNLLACGEQVRDLCSGTHHELGGFFDGLREAAVDAVPLFAARATPYGTISAEGFDELLRLMFEQLDPVIDSLDGLLLAPHGATVSEKYPDADGYWLTQVRRRVGTKMPIVATLDPHGNLSPAMVSSCNILLSYRSNPHLDQRARGVEAAELIVRLVRGEINPVIAASYPPIAINIERQKTTAAPCQPLYEIAERMKEDPRVLTNSIMLGFPYADVVEMGSAFMVVTDGEAELAQRYVDELSHYLWDHREEFAGQLIGIDDAIEQALSLQGPVCLLDMGDNVGGGSPADSTHLVSVLHERKIPSSFACLFDPESAQAAIDAGVGKSLRLQVGGKTDDRHGQPIEDEFTVKGIYDGFFEEPQPRHGGMTSWDQGPSAVVTNADGLTLLINSVRTAPFSIHQLTSCGLSTSEFHLLVAKGVQLPVASYSPVCSALIRVNTPGSTTADMMQLDYRRRRKPMFPFERDAAWTASSS